MRDKESMRGVGGGRGFGLRRDSLGSYTIVDRSPSRQTFTIVGADDELSVARSVLARLLAARPEAVDERPDNIKLVRSDAVDDMIAEVKKLVGPSSTDSTARNALYVAIRERGGNWGVGPAAGRRSTVQPGGGPWIGGKRLKIGPFTIGSSIGHERIGRLGRIGRVGTPNSMWAYRHDIKATSNPNLSPMDPFPVDFALNQRSYLNPPSIAGDGTEKI